MIKKKMKVLIALSISCSILLTQIAMADTAAVTQTMTQTVTVSDGQVKPQDEIKTKISKDEAIKIIKAFKFTEGYEMSSIFLENNGGANIPIWRMDLYTEQYFSNTSVSISANTGELLNYNSWQQQNSKKYIATINKKKAKEIADKFLAENVNTEAKGLEYIPNSDYTYERTGGIYEMPQYNFSYAVRINGIIANDMNYSIAINACTGTVLNFYSQAAYLKEIKYPKAEGIKDLAQLKNKYISLLEMQLQYLITYDNNKAKAYLAYIPAISGLMNAKTMDIVSDYIYNNGSELSQSIKYNPINPAAKVTNKEITEDQALETIKNQKNYIEKLVGVKFEDRQNRSIRMDSEDKIISRYYNIMDDSQNYGLSISMNLSTGNVTDFSFYQYFNGNNEKQKEVVAKVGYKDAKKLSDEIIKNLFVKQYGTYSDNNKAPDSTKDYIKLQPNHEFQYTRFENGILVGNSINISIDKETGKLSHIYMSWNDLDFTKADNLISAKDAKDLYLKDAEFDLGYYTPYINIKGTIDRAEEAVIVFKPTNKTTSKYVNAETGKLVDYSGRPIQNPYFDDKHWAAENIEMLETQGIVLKNITNYDEKLSRQDAIKMLSLTMGIQYYINGESHKKDSFTDINKDNEYYKYIESAVENGIINATGASFNGTQKITKGEYVISLVDMLGYKEIAKHSELFLNSSNIKTDEIYISFCKALDILPVKQGDTFNANDTITFAEAAFSLKKALKYFR